MVFYLDDGPIIACSTGTTSNTALAVIRLSGFTSVSDFQPFFSIDLSDIKARYAYLTNLVFDTIVIDNILLTFFPYSASFNGENILEMSVHGNQLNVSRIISMFIANSNVRLAGPGEFSYRALKHGKLSLSQVEGLDMLLNASSSLMLDQGLHIMQGELHQSYLALYDAFLKLKAAVEISIDFSEDVGDFETTRLMDDSFSCFRDLLFSLYSRTQGSVSSLLSPDIVICGETNAGKSSLFNLLLKHNRSIVSAIPGTTRDYVSELVTVDGINFRLVDTAGVRDSLDVIESEGIDRAFSILASSFYKILVIDPLNFNSNYLLRFKDISFDLVIFSHSDSPFFIGKIESFDFSFLISTHFISASFLTGSIGPMVDFINGPIEPATDSGPIEPDFEVGPIEPKRYSGPIEPLVKKFIWDKFNKIAASNPILLDRHRSCIAKTYTKFIELEENIKNINDIAIISSEVNIISSYLTELVGVMSADDVLNSIFSNFCIGK
jgi:tRNA modification GTPase